MRGIINHWQEVAYSHPHEMREQDGRRERERKSLFYLTVQGSLTLGTAVLWVISAGALQDKTILRSLSYGKANRLNSMWSHVKNLKTLPSSTQINYNWICLQNVSRWSLLQTLTHHFLVNCTRRKKRQSFCNPPARDLYTQKVSRQNYFQPLAPFQLHHPVLYFRTIFQRIMSTTTTIHRNICQDKTLT